MELEVVTLSVKVHMFVHTAPKTTGSVKLGHKRFPTLSSTTSERPGSVYSKFPMWPDSIGPSVTVHTLQGKPGWREYVPNLDQPWQLEV